MPPIIQNRLQRPLRLPQESDHLLDERGHRSVSAPFDASPRRRHDLPPLVPRIGLWSDMGKGRLSSNGKHCSKAVALAGAQKQSRPKSFNSDRRHF
jgi:hypothetical protein